MGTKATDQADRKRSAWVAHQVHGGMTVVYVVLHHWLDNTSEIESGHTNEADAVAEAARLNAAETHRHHWYDVAKVEAGP